METVNVPDTAAQWTALVGILIPFVVAFINNQTMSSQTRQLVMIAVAVVVGVGGVIASGNFDLKNWMLTLTTTIGACQAAYTLVWKPTGVANVVEMKTTRAAKRRRVVKGNSQDTGTGNAA